MEEIPQNFLSDNKQVAQFELVLSDHPYEIEAIETIKYLQEKEKILLKDLSFNNIHYAGQTAEQVDIQHMNKRDMIILFSLVIVLMTLVLGFQTRSILMPLLMMGTILISYAATLGFRSEERRVGKY